MNSVTGYIRHWWWLVFCALSGAALVNAVLLFVPLQYSGQAQITINFDYMTYLDWNDVTMLKFSNAAGQVLYHPDMIQTVLTRAEQQGVLWTEKEFRQRTDIEQRYYDWILMVHSTDPQETQTILNIWFDTISATLEKERDSLIQISGSQTQTELLVSCMQKLPVEPSLSTCCYGNETALQSAFVKTQQEIDRAKLEIRFLPTNTAAFHFLMIPPSGILTHETPSWIGIVLLLGGMVGFSIGMVTLPKGYPEMLFKGRSKKAL